MDDSIVLNKAKYSKILRDRAEKLAPEFDAPPGENPSDAFLKRIEGIESSYGQNLDHKEMEQGIHQGDSAQGRYGLMPHTAIDISNKIGNNFTELGRYTQGIEMPDIKALAGMPKEQVVEQIAKPDIEQKLARLLAQELSLKQNGDERRMAEAWNKGSNLSYDKITPEQLAESNYVKKFDDTKNHSINKIAMDKGSDKDSLKDLEGRLTLQMANWLAKNETKGKFGL